MTLKSTRWLCLIATPIIFSACLKETSLLVKAGFEHRIETENQTTPVVVSLTNISTGADFYEWIFEGGSPSESREKNPDKITFSQPGDHRITLRAWNDLEEATSQLIVRVDSAVTVGFDYQIQVNDFAPANVEFTNNTIGATSFEWTFEKGTPTSSTLSSPGTVLFNEGGEHKVILKVFNGSEYFQAEKTITLRPRMVTDFSLEPILSDIDMQAPLTAIVKNLSQNFLSHKWTCEGGVIQNDTAAETTIRFQKAGTYTVVLSTDNLKEQQTVKKQITVKDNSGLHIFNDIRFGINEAKNTVGCFFAADKQRVLLSKEITNIETGKRIDIGFFALNSDFDYCYFFSPDKATQSAFAPIPGATRTKVQNKPTGGNKLTPDVFNRIEKGSDMDTYSFTEGSSSDDFVLDNLPLFVFFQTEDGRRGIVYLKEVVRNGKMSYIVTDIKIEKRLDE